MVFYIDSSSYTEIEHALENVWVKGITTNPTIINKNRDSTEDILKRLSHYPIEEVFYQIKSTNIKIIKQNVIKKWKQYLKILVPHLKI